MFCLSITSQVINFEKAKINVECTKICRRIISMFISVLLAHCKLYVLSTSKALNYVCYSIIFVSCILCKNVLVLFVQNFYQYFYNNNINVLW